MLNEIEFKAWAENLDFSEETIVEIQKVRHAPPARRVGGGRKNVSGKYSSIKMGQTIQFESHKVELPTVYELEFDDNVLEYYDQPTKIKVVYNDGQRKSAVWKTADYFVVEKNRAYWVECKTEEELNKLSLKNPERYFKNDDIWIFKPGKEYAEKFKLDFIVKSSESINWNFQRNIEFLADYMIHEHVLEDINIGHIKTLIISNPGMTLEEVLKSKDIKADDVYSLIANKEIYIDFNNVLIANPETVKLYLNAEQFKSLTLFENNTSRKKAINKIELNLGNKVFWGQSVWQIINRDFSENIVFLYNENEKKSVELPLEIFEKYIADGYITGINEVEESNENNEFLKTSISESSEKDLRYANEKFEVVKSYLAGREVLNLNVSERTVRTWVKKYKEAEETYGNGFIGLLPRTKKRGNRESKLPLEIKALMEEVIAESYENIKLKSIKAVYRELLVKCDEKKLIPPSYQTFCKEIKMRSVYDVEKARKGEKAAYKYEELHHYLEFTTPKHGDRVFEIVHIDHTELDIQLKVNGETTMRPWLTLMVDAYSRRVLAFYLTFDAPSFRSCMMVLRECVKRYNRLPTNIVVDGGKEFSSIYFESLLAMYRVNKKQRPPAKGRFGNVVERLFGISNSLLIHNLQGNTQIMKNVRQVTKSVNPKNHAVWTIENLTALFDDWLGDVYDNMLNPSLFKTPKEMYIESIEQSGERLNTYIPYDDTFILMTLPSPENKERKVFPGMGIKLAYAYYWCDEFRNPEIENKKVEVKYDPFNMGIAYAYIKGQWTKCFSEQYDYLVGKTEKEIKIISEEIRANNTVYSRNNTVTARRIANFIRESEILEEAFTSNVSRIDGDIDPEKDLINKESEVTSPSKKKNFKSEIFGELI